MNQELKHVVNHNQKSKQSKEDRRPPCQRDEPCRKSPYCRPGCHCIG